MSQYRIAVLVGSLRKDSFNRKLAAAVERLAPQDLVLSHIEIGDLPLYNQDDDANQHANVKRLKKELGEAQGFLFVTPEYNRSVPGVLKNAIDHGTRPYGQNAWGGKPAGILGMSPGAMGTALAQQHLRNILAAIDVAVMPGAEAYLQMRDGMFDADGAIGEGSRKFLQGWVDKYAAWVKKHAAG